MMEGDLRILTISYRGGSYYPIACVTTNGLSESTEMISTTTRDNDDWKTYVPSKQSASIDFSGVLETTGDFTIYDLRLISRGGKLIDWKISSTEGGDIYSGEGYFTSLSEDASVESFVTFTGSIQVSGDITTT